MTTRGFRDALEIGYQARPKIFAMNIIKPEQLYADVVEVDERVLSDGTIEKAPDLAAIARDLVAAKERGFDAIAIVFMHAYRYPEHERQVARLAREMGFGQVSVSHECSALIKLVGRGDTTVVDAYLSPILARYVAARVERARRQAHRRARDVHDVVGRIDGGGAVRRQGRDTFRPGRRRRRDGADRAQRRL